MGKWKEAEVGTPRRGVRERCLPPARTQTDGPAVRPYLNTPEKKPEAQRKSILHFPCFRSSAFPRLSALTGNFI